MNPRQLTKMEYLEMIGLAFLASPDSSKEERKLERAFYHAAKRLDVDGDLYLETLIRDNDGIEGP